MNQSLPVHETTPIGGSATAALSEWLGSRVRADKRSVRAIGIAAGVGKDLIRRVLNGQTVRPTESTIRQMAEFFGDDPVYVLMLAGHVQEQRPTPDPAEFVMRKDWLRAALEARHETIHAAVAGSGVTAGVWSGILESADHLPRPTTIEEIAFYFGVEPLALSRLSPTVLYPSELSPLIAAVETKRIHERLSVVKTAHILGLSPEAYYRLRMQPKTLIRRRRTCKAIAEWVGMPLEEALQLRMQAAGVPKDAGARRRKHKETVPLAPCACGCGQPIQGPTARFIRGHHVRTAEWRNDTYGPRVTVPCQNCGRSFDVKPSHRARARFHDWWCWWTYRRQLRAWNDLQRRILRRVAETRTGLKPFAAQAGVGSSALVHWFGKRGSATSQKNLERLAVALGISTDQAIAEAGGFTTEERRREVGRERARLYFPAAGSEERRELGRRVGAWGRGRHKAPEAVARTTATRRATGAHDRFLAAAAAKSRSTEGRACQSLRSYLRHHGSPSLKELRAWARQTAGRLDVCTSEVIGWWNPRLKTRGLPGLPGRPSYAQICHQLRTHLTTHPWPQGEQRPHRYWANAPATQGWSEGHARGCPALHRALTSRDVSASAGEVYKNPLRSTGEAA